MLDRCVDWLGFGSRGPVVGLHLTVDQLRVAAVRPPGRLVAIGRAAVPIEPGADPAIAIANVRELANRLRLAPGTPAVAAIEPATTALRFGNGTGAGHRHTGADVPSCHAGQPALDQAAVVASMAGLDLVHVDVVPAALARLASLGPLGPHGVVVRASPPWWVRAGPHYTEAVYDGSSPERPSGRCQFGIGPDANSLQWLDQWPGIDVPAPLVDLLDAGRDAVAVGAALAAFELPPLITVQPWPEPAPLRPPPPEHRNREGDA